MVTTTTATVTTTTVTTTTASTMSAGAINSIAKACRMKVTVPPEFKGTESAERWFSRFELCSRSNGWDEEAMLTQVLPLMAGDALDLLLDQDGGDLSDYKAVKALMIKEFDLSELRERYVLDFNSRRLQAGEEYNVFMRALKILARKAYPDFDDAPRRALVADPYRESMPERIKTMLPLLNLYPGDLDQLVSETRRLSKATPHHDSAHGVAAISAQSSSDGGAVGGSTNDVILAKLMSIEQQMTKISVAQGDLEVRVNSLYSRPQASGGGAVPPKGKSSSKLTCWGCHEMGHTRKECPQLGGGSGRSGTPRSEPVFYPHVTCTKCGNNGHYAPACKLSENK